MDKQLLKALDNLSVGLEQLAEALKQKGGPGQSETSTALQAGDFSKSIEQISVEIKSIKSDTQEILKNQQTLIALHKEKQNQKKTDELEGSGDPKKESNLKKGVGTILLIALAVLAIGLAFKIVGKVDILSVLALGVGIMLVAYAFEKVSKIKGPDGGPMTIKQALTTSAIMVMTSLAITMSSWILSKISPVSIPQLLTAATIALLFTIIGPSIAKMIKAMTTPMEVEARGIKIKTSQMSFGTIIQASIMVPLLMVTMSIGIMLSSKILSKVTPISFPQMLTAILIGLLFAVVAKGIAGMITAFTTSQEASGAGFGFKTSSIGMGKMAAVVMALPIVMLMIATGITWSSHILSRIKPIGLMQAFTAILIGAMFAVVSMGIAKLINSLNGVNPVAILLLPILLVAISWAISLSAQIFASYKKDFNKLDWITLIKITLVGIIVGIIGFIMSFAIKKMGKLDISTVILAPAMFTLLSLSVALSAWIFAKFKSSIDKLEFMTMFKLAVFGIALSITLLAVSFAAKMINKWLTPIDALKAGITMIIMAGVIMLSSLILSLGSYKKYPDWKWSLGVSLALGAFGLGAILLGTQTLNPFFYAGLGIILLVSGIIVATSYILGAGNYKKYPTASWSMGVGLALSAFGLGAVLLGFNVLNPFFYAGLGMLLVVAKSVVSVSKILAKGVYKNSITKSWAESISIALGAFSQVYDMLANSTSLFGGGPSPKQFTDAIIIVSKGITTAAEYFNKHSGAFKNGPPLKWAQGVGTALGAFAPVFKLMENFPFTAGTKISRAIVHVADAIIKVALHFNKYKGVFSASKGAYPSYEWSRGVREALDAFSPIFNALSENDSWFTSGEEVIDQMVYGIRSIARAITSTAKSFSSIGTKAWTIYPSDKWSNKVRSSIIKFTNIYDVFEKRGYTTASIFKSSVMVSMIIKSLINTANLFYNNRKKFDLKTIGDVSSWFRGISSTIMGFVKLNKWLKDNIYQKVTRTFGFKSKWLGDRSFSVTTNEMMDLSLIPMMAEKIVDTAMILNKGNFNQKIDPFYMRKIGQNLIDFTFITKKIAEAEGKTSFLGRLGSSIDSALGNDPISQVSRRMVTLAKGYDAMATALIKLGAALRLLKLKDLSELGSITKSLSGGNVDLNQRISPVKTKSLFTVSEEKKKRKLNSEEEKRNEILYVSKKLDEAVVVLKAIRANTGNIDSFVSGLANKPKGTPDIGTK